MQPETLLLDCTLRDGGYYNDWDFSRDLIQAYLEAMKAAQVDIVELGGVDLGCLLQMLVRLVDGPLDGPQVLWLDRFQLLLDDTFIRLLSPQRNSSTSCKMLPDVSTSWSNEIPTP